MPLHRSGRCHVVLAVFVCCLALAMASLSSSPSLAMEGGKQGRTPWTTSRVTGSPDPPPPYKLVRAFPQLQFERPVLMARCPGSDRLFVGEQRGVLYSFPNRLNAKADVFLDLRKEIQTVGLHPDAKEVETVYGLVFHPDFQTNCQCFVCYTLRGKNSREPNLVDGTRVSRFRVTASEPPRIDPASEEIVLTFLQGGHNGGDLHFGPDGMLYISTGDAASPNPPDPLNTGQDISDLLSSILRIDVDRRDEGRNYAIPSDNPFVGRIGARPEVWAYGFRNPWRMSFDPRSGELFVGDVGWELWEMVHRVERGGNYGWSAMEGPQPIKSDKIGPTPIHPPLVELPHTIACSITGGYVYRGSRFPELAGAYIFGDWETRRVWAARFEGDQTKEMVEIAPATVRMSTFGEDNAGELYLLDYDRGTLHTLERNDAAGANTDFPQTLSATGLFSSVKDNTPAPGVVPFAINSRQWLDGAATEHWVALPGESSVVYYERGKPIPGLVHWHSFRMHFPKDAVLLRTLSLDEQRLETQLLHYDGLDWRAYTYMWRDDQTDADLVPAEGADKEIRHGDDVRVWQFQSRSQCMSCHSNQSEYALAFLPEQLNRIVPGGRNQLVELTETGVITRGADDGRHSPPFSEATLARERKIADPADESQPLAARARGYLHANCGHCHSDHGGGAVPLRLDFFTPEARMNAIGERPTRGDFGLPDAQIIKPGDPYASTLVFRMAKFGRDRMPHIGCDRPDETGLRLVEEWIAAMESAAAQGSGSPSESSEPTSMDQALADPRSALVLARKLGHGALSSEQKVSLLAAAANLPLGNVRDLFEGYLPTSNTGERKLGSSPRPQSILSLHGDAARGKQLFWSEAVNCGKCHQLAGRGTPVGPDLAAIGSLRSQQDLLESLLAPSRRIEPKYAAYVIRTVDGRVLTGVLVSRTTSTVVLRDAQGQQLTLEADAIEEMQPSRTSLMPEGQMAGLTAQQAADLLAYLASCRGETSAPPAQ